MTFHRKETLPKAGQTAHPFRPPLRKDNMVWKKRMGWRLLAATSALGLAACQPKNFESQKLMVENSTRSLGCPNSKSLIFDALYRQVDKNGAWEREPIAEFVQEQIDSLYPHLSQETRADLKQNLVGLFEVFANEIAAKESSLTMVQRLIELEMQDSATEAFVAANHKLENQWQQLKSLAQNTECLPPVAPPKDERNEDTLPDEEAPGDSTETPTEPVIEIASLASAINKSVATAYQTCKVLDLSPMDSHTPSVSGIRILPTPHPGGGRQREIANASLVAQTHYYVREYQHRTGCFDVKRSPLIYDFGGQPAVAENSLSYFSNSGTGTTALGVDCSAFVSTILSVGGRRYKESLVNKPIYVRQSSAKFLNPESSGFNCLARVSLTQDQTIATGDIIAISGHVVMIDQVATDPFGLNDISSPSQCSGLKAENFRFAVVQSSPSKLGIGINRYWVKDYAKESSSMRAAFERIGYFACLAKTKGIVQTPRESNFSLIRSRDSESCQSPKISLVGESCVAGCGN